MITPRELNSIFAMAMFIALLKENRFVTNDNSELNGVMNIEKKSTVPMLKNRLK